MKPWGDGFLVGALVGLFIVLALPNFFAWTPALGSISDVVVAVTAVVSAIGAFRAIDSWRREAHWKEDRELARRIGRSVREVRRGFQRVRRPLFSTDEYPEHLQNVDNPQGAQRRERQKHIYENRFEVLRIAMKELDSHLLEADVIWGNEAERLMRSMNRIYDDLIEAARFNVADQHHEPDDWQDFGDKDRRREVREMLEDYSMFPSAADDAKQNPFTIRIDEALAEIELFCQPHLETRRLSQHQRQHRSQRGDLA